MGVGFQSFPGLHSQVLPESYLAGHLSSGACCAAAPFSGGLMSPCFSCRVTCLCAQFEAVLQHGMKRSRGLALTAAAIKQAAGFTSKTETGTQYHF